MNSEPIIKVKNISKIYNIYDKPEDRLKQATIAKLNGKRYYREFVALQNINFELKKGESIGLIGRNGAGKSTLLQIIAGTLTPSSGEITVNGRVNALLELGSGFNPEFTGRENVYLNGSILGFSKEEIDKKFEEIHSFSEIGNFIDQPVKTYSSGMFVKLAFSVQGILEPDILIVDEALSVGDIFFQRKCAKLIQKLLEGDTTFIFVSHSMQSIISYCEHAILLHNGKALYHGSSIKAASLYYQIERLGEEGIIQLAEKMEIEQKSNDTNFTESKELSTSSPDDWPELSSFSSVTKKQIVDGDFGQIELISFCLCDSQNIPSQNFTMKDYAYFYFIVKANSDLESPVISFSILNRMNITLFGRYSYQFDDSKIKTAPMKKNDILRIKLKVRLDLTPEEYMYYFAFHTMNEFDLSNIENMSHMDCVERTVNFFAVQVGSFTIEKPKKGIYMPFNGAVDLVSELSMI